MAQLKKYWWVFALVAVAAWYIFKKVAAPSTFSQDTSGYPNDERASAHFTWKELTGGARSDQSATEELFAVALARTLEYIRHKNGDLPVLVSAFALGDEFADYQAFIKADVGEKSDALAQPVADANSAVSGFPHAFTYTPNADGFTITGDKAALIAAVASGAVAV